jgi:citrate synthase
VFAAPICQSRRGYASSKEESLKEAMVRLVPVKRELLKKVKAVGDKKLGDVKVENALGGMR